VAAINTCDWGDSGSCYVSRWLRATGDHVEIGDDIAEIESSKASIVVQAPHSGTLNIIKAVYEAIATGETIATID
jgi:pyruvate/2-oxoglutarate dehydrogenase complex dihydrolipoamide acyltransferase (E2) component